MKEFNGLKIPVDFNTVDISKVPFKDNSVPIIEKYRHASCYVCLHKTPFVCKGIDCNYCLFLYKNRYEFEKFYLKNKRYGKED